jgi:hypothetical protein
VCRFVFSFTFFNYFLTLISHHHKLLQPGDAAYWMFGRHILKESDLTRTLESLGMTGKLVTLRCCGRLRGGMPPTVGSSSSAEDAKTKVYVKVLEHNEVVHEGRVGVDSDNCTVDGLRDAVKLKWPNLLTDCDADQLNVYLPAHSVEESLSVYTVVVANVSTEPYVVRIPPPTSGK